MHGMITTMKAMQVLASEIDKQSIRNHPKEAPTFADDVDRILKDEHGNLQFLF